MSEKKEKKQVDCFFAFRKWESLYLQLKVVGVFLTESQPVWIRNAYLM